MSSEAYELLALLMRYVFVFIGLMIVWRSFRWLSRDARAYQKEMRALPDAGMIGEMVNLYTGEAQPLPHEGTIGSSGKCDIRLKDRQVRACHARFEFEEGKGLKIIPVRHSALLLSGVQVQKAAYALHGTQLQLGDSLLRVRLFAGLNVPYPVAYPEPDAVLDAEESQEGLLPASQEEEYMPYQVGSIPPGAPLEPYEGHYTEDGQMTWQYAYTLDELRSAMQEEGMQQMEPDGTAPEGEEGVPYQSPLHQRRRRRRHD